MNLLERLPEDWSRELNASGYLPDLEKLETFLEEEYASRQIFPPQDQLFRAMRLTPFEKVKVVWLGQDPYHDDGQACGLAFSVPAGVPAPPSLKNMLKEYSDDLGLPMPLTTSLEPWAASGVLMLNTVLTVRAHEAGSHTRKGWEPFTDAVIRTLVLRRPHLVFVLLGRPAQTKMRLIDTSRHVALCSSHPSPLSVYRGFAGSRIYSKANEALVHMGQPPVDWRL